MTRKTIILIVIVLSLFVLACGGMAMVPDSQLMGDISTSVAATRAVLVP